MWTDVKSEGHSIDRLLSLKIKTATLMCLVMSTSQGRRLQRRDSLTISQRSLALETLRETPRPHLFEQGLHEVV